jgi:hypothetical protein
MSSNQTCEDSGVPAFIRDKLVLYPEPVRRLATRAIELSESHKKQAVCEQVVGMIRSQIKATRDDGNGD